MSQFAQINPNINKQKVNVPFAGLTSHHLSRMTCDKIMLRQSLPISNGVYISINEALQANRICRLWHYSLDTHNPYLGDPQWQCCVLVLHMVQRFDFVCLDKSQKILPHSFLALALARPSPKIRKTKYNYCEGNKPIIAEPSKWYAREDLGVRRVLFPDPTS